jgi:hypothetical protein
VLGLKRLDKRRLIKLKSSPAREEVSMPQIYVNTDNSNATNKIFNASALGKAAGAAEKKMKEAVVEAVSKLADFTTDKPGKGYSLRMKVLSETVGRATKYTVNLQIVRYPLVARKGGKGEELVPTTNYKPGSATVEGVSEAEVLDLIAELTKNNVKASLPVMKIDMTRR